MKHLILIALTLSLNTKLLQVLIHEQKAMYSVLVKGVPNDSSKIRHVIDDMIERRYKELKSKPKLINKLHAQLNTTKMQ